MASIERKRGGIIIFITVFVTLLLTVIDLPNAIKYWRPPFVALVVIYWCLAIPNRFGIVTAWFIGLFIDLLTESPVGQHALGFAVVGYIVLNFYQRIRISPMVQQTLTVFAILILYQLLIAWFTGITHHSRSPQFFLASVTGAVLWPIFFVFLRSLRRRFRIK
jgi:rod shape-determining protein MreD